MYARHAYDHGLGEERIVESCPTLSSKLIPNGLNPSGNNYVGDTGIRGRLQRTFSMTCGQHDSTGSSVISRLTNMSLVTSQFELTETWLPRKSKDKPWEVDPTSLSPWKDIQPTNHLR